MTFILGFFPFVKKIVILYTRIVMATSRVDATPTESTTSRAKKRRRPIIQSPLPVSQRNGPVNKTKLKFNPIPVCRKNLGLLVTDSFHYIVFDVGEKEKSQNKKLIGRRLVLPILTFSPFLMTQVIRNHTHTPRIHKSSTVSLCLLTFLSIFLFFSLFYSADV